MSIQPEQLHNTFASCKIIEIAELLLDNHSPAPSLTLLESVQYICDRFDSLSDLYSFLVNYDEIPEETFNESTVEETVLCLINDRKCYLNLSRSINAYKSGDYTVKWLKRKLDQYFNYCFKLYMKEYCDKSTKERNLWSYEDIKQIKKALIGYYSQDGDNDLITKAIANSITAFNLLDLD